MKKDMQKNGFISCVITGETDECCGKVINHCELIE